MEKKKCLNIILLFMIIGYCCTLKLNSKLKKILLRLPNTDDNYISSSLFNNSNIPLPYGPDSTRTNDFDPFAANYMSNSNGFGNSGSNSISPWTVASELLNSSNAPNSASNFSPSYRPPTLNGNRTYNFPYGLSSPNNNSGLSGVLNDVLNMYNSYYSPNNTSGMTSNNNSNNINRPSSNVVSPPPDSTEGDDIPNSRSGDSSNTNNNNIPENNSNNNSPTTHPNIPSTVSNSSVNSIPNTPVSNSTVSSAPTTDTTVEEVIDSPYPRPNPNNLTNVRNNTPSNNITSTSLNSTHSVSDSNSPSPSVPTTVAEPPRSYSDAPYENISFPILPNNTNSIVSKNINIEWASTSALAADLAINQRGDLYFIDTKFKIQKYDINSNTTLPFDINTNFSVFKIYIAPDDTIFVTGEGGSLYFLNSKKTWQSIQGCVNSVAVGKNKALYAIGCDPNPNGFGVYKLQCSYNSTLYGSNLEKISWDIYAQYCRWEGLNTGGNKVEILKNNTPIIINNQNQLLYRPQDKWISFLGLNTKDISVARNSIVYVVDMNSNIVAIDYNKIPIATYNISGSVNKIAVSSLNVIFATGNYNKLLISKQFSFV